MYKLGAVAASYLAALAAAPKARMPLAMALTSWVLLMRGFHGETFRTMFKSDVDDPEEIKMLMQAAQGRARL